MVRATRRLDRAPGRVGPTAMIGLIVALVFPGAATPEPGGHPPGRVAAAAVRGDVGD